MTQDNLFDYAEAQAAKSRGMKRAASHRSDDLETARSIARHLAQTKGSVTADDVQKELIARDIDLGNAAGSIFKTKDFVWTGEFYHSERVIGHGNLLRVWKLK